MIQAADSTVDALVMEPVCLENLEALYLQCVDASSKALSVLIGSEVPVRLCGLGLVPFSEIPCLLQDDQRYQKGVHSKITGDLRGDIYLFFSRKSAHKLVQIGFKHKGLGSLFLNRLEESFLNEFVNILINAFWRIFNENIPVRWILTPPKTLNYPANTLNLANRVFARDCIAILADLALGASQVDAVLCFLPSKDSLDRFVGHLQ